MNTLSNATVCIVDDDDAVRDSLRLLLESYGITVKDFGCAGDLLKCDAARNCRCLLLDLHMPVMSGLSLLETLRADNIEVPAVMITGQVTPELAARIREMGLSEILPKPIGEADLLRSIESAIAQCGNA